MSRYIYECACVHMCVCASESGLEERERCTGWLTQADKVICGLYRHAAYHDLSPFQYTPGYGKVKFYFLIHKFL
jgi:hypothetical protein